MLSCFLVVRLAWKATGKRYEAGGGASITCSNTSPTQDRQEEARGTSSRLAEDHLNKLSPSGRQRKYAHP